MKNLFPVFKNSDFKGRQMVYLDSAATTLIPASVTEQVDSFIHGFYGPIRRGLYSNAEQSTEMVESIRRKYADFLNCPPSGKIVFTSGATQGVNLIVQNFGNNLLSAGDKIVVTESEHHSNILPWIHLKNKIGCDLVWLKLNSSNEIDPESIDWNDNRLKVLSFSLVSNVNGTVAPYRQLMEKARKQGIFVHIDAAQAMSAVKPDLTESGCDFMTFSGHKIHAYPGIGVCYVSSRAIEYFEPAYSGGGMVATLDKSNYTAQPMPHGMEAGSPNSVGIASMGAALDFISNLNIREKTEKNLELINDLKKWLESEGKASTVNAGNPVSPILSFNADGIHPHDAAGMLAAKNICVRAGHHCAKIFMDAIRERAVLRVSLGCYNDREDIERFKEAWLETLNFFKPGT